jgi:hypothetical protein
VYFQTIPFITQENRNFTHINNYRDFVFQVWPGLSFQAFKEKIKAEKEKSILRAALREAGNNDAVLEEYSF